jgi:hypothetical protein
MELNIIISIYIILYLAGLYSTLQNQNFNLQQFAIATCYTLFFVVASSYGYDTLALMGLLFPILAFIVIIGGIAAITSQRR